MIHLVWFYDHFVGDIPEEKEFYTDINLCLNECKGRETCFIRKFKIIHKVISNHKVRLRKLNLGIRLSSIWESPDRDTLSQSLDFLCPDFCLVVRESYQTSVWTWSGQNSKNIKNLKKLKYLKIEKMNELKNSKFRNFEFSIFRIFKFDFSIFSIAKMKSEFCSDPVQSLDSRPSPDPNLVFQSRYQFGQEKIQTLDRIWICTDAGHLWTVRGNLFVKLIQVTIHLMASQW